MKYEKTTTMTLEQRDREYLAYGNLVLAEIKCKMETEGANDLVNTYTGEMIPAEEIARAFWVVDSLLDTQEDWSWGMM